jgi:DNA-binding transcriptional regulator YdaS (Cro superfamily)
MENKRTTIAALLDKAGTQTALAETLGTSQQNISNWLRSDKPLPAELVLAAEMHFGFSRHRLRPDIYPEGTT